MKVIYIVINIINIFINNILSQCLFKSDIIPSLLYLQLLYFIFKLHNFVSCTLIKYLNTQLFMRATIIYNIDNVEMFDLLQTLISIISCFMVRHNLQHVVKNVNAYPMFKYFSIMVHYTTSGSCKLKLI